VSSSYVIYIIELCYHFMLLGGFRFLYMYEIMMTNFIQVVKNVYTYVQRCGKPVSD